VRIAARRDRDRAGSPVEGGAGVVAEQHASNQRAPRATDDDQISPTVPHEIVQSTRRRHAPDADDVGRSRRALPLGVQHRRLAVEHALLGHVVTPPRNRSPGGHVREGEARAGRREPFGKGNRIAAPFSAVDPDHNVVVHGSNVRRGRAGQIVGGVRLASVVLRNLWRHNCGCEVRDCTQHCCGDAVLPPSPPPAVAAPPDSRQLPDRWPEAVPGDLSVRQRTIGDGVDRGLPHARDARSCSVRA